MSGKILIIEDEISLRLSLKKLIQLRKYQVDEVETLKAADQKITNYQYDIFLLDMRLPDGSGLELLKKHRTVMEGRTIVITAHATISSAVDAIKNGAFYYLEKPLDEELLFIQMEKIAEIMELRARNSHFKNELAAHPSSDTIIYASRQMGEAVAMARKFAKTDSTVLIQGNTGVGKEVMAHFIHRNSKRSSNTFLPINCSSIPEQLFESELFGFKKGAFTGASENYSGRFVQADKGTLFLDEIGEMPLSMQAKLLRVLEDEAVYQLGNTTPKKIDVRLIAATNKNLREEADAGRFRKDLYFRLKGTQVHIPPLSDRKKDIMPLVHYFISVYNNLFDNQINRITADAESFLMEYSWDGNIRELKNAVKSIFSLNTTGVITSKHLMMALHHQNDNPVESSFVTLEEHEGKYIKKVLAVNGFNIKKTAEILGVSRNKLYRKLKSLQINIDEKRESNCN